MEIDDALNVCSGGAAVLFPGPDPGHTGEGSGQFRIALECEVLHVAQRRGHGTAQDDVAQR